MGSYIFNLDYNVVMLKSIKRVFSSRFERCEQPKFVRTIPHDTYFLLQRGIQPHFKKYKLLSNFHSSLSFFSYLLFFFFTHKPKRQVVKHIEVEKPSTTTIIWLICIYIRVYYSNIYTNRYIICLCVL